MATTKDIARRFIQEVRSELTVEQLQEVVEKNSTEAYEGCCATHDFCDANLLMEAAWISLGLKTPIEHDAEDIETSKVYDKWNEAWDLAKAAHFNEEEL